MSKPDAASGSLESILASIRKSLSEQSVEASSDVPPAPAEAAKDAAGRKGGLAQRLAGTSSDAGPTANGRAGDDLADLLEEPAAGAPAPAKSAAAAATANAAPTAPGSAAPAPAASTAQSLPEEDPLWFLTRRDESAAAEAPLPAEAAGQSSKGGTAQVAEAILTRPEVVRATMPPFFGSTTEAIKSEASAQEASVAIRQPPPRAAEAASAPPSTPKPPGNSPLLMNRGVDAARAGPQPVAGHALSNGKITEPGEVAGAAEDDNPQTRALEAAVLELLKPMLSQWLDRNMPRLLAEALKDEAARARAAAEGGSKKA